MSGISLMNVKRNTAPKPQKKQSTQEYLLYDLRFLTYCFEKAIQYRIFPRFARSVKPAEKNRQSLSDEEIQMIYDYGTMRRHHSS